MSIDRFSLPQFEAALPKERETGRRLWQWLGVAGGEHCYLIPVREGVAIYVRSSIRADGFAADTAEDSIRAWLAADDSGKPLGSKQQRWIARTPGWDRRLTETLRALWRIGKRLGKCVKAIEQHPDAYEPPGGWQGAVGRNDPVRVPCGGQMLALKIKKGSNKGRWITKCSACGGWGDFLPEPEQLQLKESKR